MSSEAAQKAYPEDDPALNWLATAMSREAFDRGAVEALWQAAARAALDSDSDTAEWLYAAADEWVVGQ